MLIFSLLWGGGLGPGDLHPPDRQAGVWGCRSVLNGEELLIDYGSEFFNIVEHNNRHSNAMWQRNVAIDELRDSQLSIAATLSSLWVRYGGAPSHTVPSSELLSAIGSVADVLLRRLSVPLPLEEGYCDEQQQQAEAREQEVQAARPTLQQMRRWALGAIPLERGQSPESRCAAGGAAVCRTTFEDD